MDFWILESADTVPREMWWFVSPIPTSLEADMQAVFKSVKVPVW